MNEWMDQDWTGEDDEVLARLEADVDAYWEAVKVWWGLAIAGRLTQAAGQVAREDWLSEYRIAEAERWACEPYEPSFEQLAPGAWPEDRYAIEDWSGPLAKLDRSSTEVW